MKEHVYDGQVHIYTGNGKGKTSAAMVIAMRSLMAGHTVFVGQFLKHTASGEVRALQMLAQMLDQSPLPEYKIHDCSPRFFSGQFGQAGFLFHGIRPGDLEVARAGFAQVSEAINSARYDVVVIDEIFGAISQKLVTTAEVIDWIKAKAAHVELVLTGRNPPAEIVELADLVSEIKDVKHYFTKGIPARLGIEL